MDVAIRDLKSKLSAYVHMAAAGEMITVTDRGRPVAVLGPPLGTVDLAGAVAAGWVTAAAAPGPLQRYKRHTSTRSVLAVLSEDRDE